MMYTPSELRPNGGIVYSTASDVRPVVFKSNRFLQILIVVYGLVWSVTAIGPNYRFDWFLENLLVFSLAALLVMTYRRFQLSNLSYLLIAVFLSLHAVGAHYTYAETPLGFWLEDLLDLERNHYDRVVHFSFGLLGAFPIREVVVRMIGSKDRLALFLSFSIVLSLSSFYEVIEWVVAEIVSPDAALAYLGTQGDVFDAQKDTALATLGALIALAVIAIFHWRSLLDGPKPPGDKEALCREE